MDSKVKAQFKQQVISACAENYGVQFRDLTFLGAWQNFVYGYEKKGAQYIMRITHFLHRSLENIQDELDFLLYLGGNGVSVSIPILSANNQCIECIKHSDNTFYVVCFKRAQGRPMIFTDDSIFHIGEITGHIHALSRQYKRDVRYHWFDNGYLQEYKKYIPDQYRTVIDNADILLSEIRALPKRSETYGLVHGDINGNNYLVDMDGKITLFDFDECQLDWYVDDIIIQLFYYTYVYEDANERAEYFLKHFMKGYRIHSDLSKEDIALMPLLMQMRELIVFTGACRGFNMNDLDAYTQRFVDRLSLMNNPLFIDIHKLKI